MTAAARGAALEVSRADVLAYRVRAGGLDRRLPRSATSLRRAAWAGAQDSMPRAALLSLHARVADVGPDVLDDPALVQVWGPRSNLYAVAAADVAPFTLGRLPTDARGRRRAVEIAERAAAVLADGAERRMDEVGHALGIHANALRYAAPTGTLHVRWDGARQPTVRLVAPPDADEREARHELLRRHLHVVGPASTTSFARWAGVALRQAQATVAELAGALVPVRTPAGEGWLFAEDEPALRAAAGAGPPTGGPDVRLLPSGDAFWLLYDDARELLVPDADLAARLWTPRVWPGAVLVDGEVAGTWRRAGTTLAVEPWRALAPGERDAVEAAAAGLPLPDAGPVRVRWTG